MTDSSLISERPKVATRSRKTPITVKVSSPMRMVPPMGLSRPKTRSATCLVMRQTLLRCLHVRGIEVAAAQDDEAADGLVAVGDADQIDGALAAGDDDGHRKFARAGDLR